MKLTFSYRDDNVLPTKLLYVRVCEIIMIHYLQFIENDS